MIKFKCKYCNKIVFKGSRGARNFKYCSRECYQKNKSKPYIAPKSKICSICGIRKKIDEFYFGSEGAKGNRKKHHAACKKCQHQYSYNWKERNHEKAKEFTRKSQHKIRMKVLYHYGGKFPKCECCGEKEEKFLQIDHIDNDGAKDRKINGYGSGFYRHIIKNNFPKNLQILCANCNQAKTRYGICSHKLKKHGQN